MAGRNSGRHLERATCEICMKLPSLNEYIGKCRANRYQAAKYKADIERDIGYYINRLPRFKHPVVIHFTWCEKNKRRDCDNVAFAKKFVLDSMVRHGKLEDDSPKYVVGFTDNFLYGNENKVIMTVQEVKE